MATYEENRKEEKSILDRERKAFEKRQNAFFAVHRQLLPFGNGKPKLESLDALDQADAEWRAIKKEVDRIAQEIRTGKRV